MILLPSRRRAAAAALVALALTGCGVGGGRRPAGASQGPAPNSPQREKLGEAITLLWKGKAKEADKIIRKVLKKTPDDRVASSLARQISEDPHVVLGADSYPYQVHDGETLSTVASRVLGDPMLFYALARYNDITVPNTVVPGQMIRLPGKLKAEAPAPKPEREREREPSRPERAPAPVPPAAPAPPPPVPAAKASDPARAARLRAAGLAAMSRGGIDRAVALLRGAAASDPGNPLIARDLQRATKIQAAVRKPK